MTRSAALTVGGGLLVCVAVLTSNAGIERALLGEATGALAWGPTLLRLLVGAQGAALICAGLLHIDLGGRPCSEPSAPAGSRRAWMVVAALTLIALALRVWRLGSGLWLDEVLTLTDFVRPPLGQILTSFPSQNQHMLFSILAHGSIWAFGESTWALRLPAALFGAASVWALFLLGRHVLGEREALLACALLTVSYHHVWFSQNARGYTGLMFFATLATWLWLQAVQRNAWRWWLAYAFALALGTWTHLTMLFVPAAHVGLSLADILARRADVKALGKAMTAWLLASSLILELHALALPEFLRSGLHEVSLPSEWTNPLWVLFEGWRSLGVAFGTYAAVLLGLSVAGIGWLGIMQQERRAALSMILPAMFGGVAMLAAGHNLWPRFFFFSIGFALLIIVHGAATAPRLIARWIAPGLSDLVVEKAGLALTGAIILVSAVSLPRAYALPKQDFAGARDYVGQARQPDDGVVAVGLAGIAFRRYFAPDWATPQTGSELAAIRRSHRRVWLVYTLPIELKTYRPDLWNEVEKEFEIVQVFPGTLGGGDVKVCRERHDADGN